MSSNPFAALFSAFPSASYSSASFASDAARDGKPNYPSIGKLLNLSNKCDQSTLRVILQKIPRDTLRTVVNAFISEHKIVIENPKENENLQTFLNLHEQLPGIKTTEDILKLTDEVKHWSYETVAYPTNFLVMGAIDRVVDEIVRHWKVLDKDAFENIVSEYAFIFNKISKRRKVDTFEKLQAQFTAKSSTQNMYDYLFDSLMKGAKGKKKTSKKDKKDKKSAKTDTSTATRGSDKSNKSDDDDEDEDDDDDDIYEDGDDTHDKDVFNPFKISDEEKNELFSYIEDAKFPKHNCGNATCHINGRNLDMAKGYTYSEWMTIAHQKRKEALANKSETKNEKEKVKEKEKEKETKTDSVSSISASASTSTSTSVATSVSSTKSSFVSDVATGNGKSESIANIKDNTKGDDELPPLVDGDLESDSDNEKLPPLEEIPASASA